MSGRCAEIGAEVSVQPVQGARDRASANGQAAKPGPDPLAMAERSESTREETGRKTHKNPTGTRRPAIREVLVVRLPESSCIHSSKTWPRKQRKAPGISRGSPLHGLRVAAAAAAAVGAILLAA